MSLHVLNADSFGISRYEGFSPVAVVESWGRLFVVTSTQVLEVGGSGTSTESFEAEVKTGMTDFGTERKKNIGHVLPAHKSSKGLEITLGVGSRGKLLERSYRIDANEEDEIRKDSKGTTNAYRERFWQVKVANRDDGDFDLQALDTEIRVSNRKD